MGIVFFGSIENATEVEQKISEELTRELRVEALRPRKHEARRQQEAPQNTQNPAHIVRTAADQMPSGTPCSHPPEPEGDIGGLLQILRITKTTNSGSPLPKGMLPMATGLTPKRPRSAKLSVPKAGH